jgi:hypothetical protein
LKQPNILRNPFSDDLPPTLVHPLFLSKIFVMLELNDVNGLQLNESKLFPDCKTRGVLLNYSAEIKIGY